MQYSDELDDLEPVFDDCPTGCHYYGKAKRIPGYCDGCDKGDLRKEYVAATTADLGGDRAKFDRLQAAVIDALDFENLPAETLTEPAARMVSIIGQERGRILRVKNWRAKVAAEQNAGN